jgi:hypothetical protein
MSELLNYPGEACSVYRFRKPSSQISINQRANEMSCSAVSAVFGAKFPAKELEGARGAGARARLGARVTNSSVEHALATL